jgi:hypothetical protein
LRTTVLANRVNENNDKLLLAQSTSNNISLEEQSQIDTKVLQEESKDLTYNQCLKESFEEEDLNSTKEQAP